MYTGPLRATSNRIAWSFAIEVIDPDTGAAFDLAGSTIVLAIRPQDQHEPTITATTANGRITLGGTGTANVLIPRSEMVGLCPGEHDVGITIVTGDGDEFQLFSGTLPVVDGVVAA